MTREDNSEKLTEQDGNMVHLSDDNVEHLVGDIFDLIRACLQFHPPKDFLLNLEISFVHGWDSLLEVQELWELFDSVLLGFLEVVNFHKGNAELIALVVDVLELTEHNVGFLVVVVVWRGKLCNQVEL